MNNTTEMIRDCAKEAGLDWHKFWNDDGTNQLEVLVMASIGNTKKVSIDVSTSDDDSGNRIFCEVVGVQDDTILLVETGRNYVDKWKVAAEYWYGQMRFEKTGDTSYLTKGALDSWIKKFDWKEAK